MTGHRPRTVFPRAGAPGRGGTPARHALRPLGGAGDGQPGQRPLPQAPGLGASLPHRTRTELRNQLVLNFARHDVAEWAYGWLTRLVGDHGIDFLKWDMNRAISEAGWPDRADGADEVWTTYVHHLYDVFDRLRADHPHLRIEACSGGGGRVDLGILARTDQAWPSDNTDAADRVAIQHGYSQLYPARTMAAWVTDVPNQLTGRSVPLRFRFHVAMAGALGIGGDLSRWSDAELAEGAGLVAEYKRVRHLVQHGTQHRLRAPVDDGPAATQYLAADGSETLLLVWQRASPHGGPSRPLRLAASIPPSATATPAPARSTPRPCSVSTGCSPSCRPATGRARRYT